MNIELERCSIKSTLISRYLLIIFTRTKFFTYFLKEINIHFGGNDVISNTHSNNSKATQVWNIIYLYFFRLFRKLG